VNGADIPFKREAWQDKLKHPPAGSRMASIRRAISLNQRSLPVLDTLGAAIQYPGIRA
jgi:hypothetical protein